MDPTEVAQAMLGPHASPDEIRALLDSLRSERQKREGHLGRLASQARAEQAPVKPVGLSAMTPDQMRMTQWRNAGTDLTKSQQERADLTMLGLSSLLGVAPEVAMPAREATAIQRFAPASAEAGSLRTVKLRGGPPARVPFQETGLEDTLVRQRPAPLDQAALRRMSGTQVNAHFEPRYMTHPSRMMQQAGDLPPGHVLFDAKQGIGEIIDKDTLARMSDADLDQFFSVHRAQGGTVAGRPSSLARARSLAPRKPSGY